MDCLIYNGLELNQLDFCGEFIRIPKPNDSIMFCKWGVTDL